MAKAKAKPEVVPLDSYPSAPAQGEARRSWVDARNRRIAERPKKPESKVFGDPDKQTPPAI
jgi:hypothetical protein